MKAERVILSFIAVVVGLVAAGGAFYLYQLTKVVPDKDKTLSLLPKVSVSPTPDKANLLALDTPTDEEVVNKKVITISGKTRSDAVIMVNSEDNDQVVNPASNGDFSLSLSIPDGTTIIYITAIYPNGEEETIKRTVTFSTENF